MKRVLIISYYWPPSGGAGVQRWLKFSKFLPEFGWEPIILTVDPNYASYPVIDDSLGKDLPKGIQVIRSKSKESFSAYKKVSGSEKIPYAGFANEKTSASPIQKFARFIRGNLFLPDPRKGWNKFALKEARKILSSGQIDCFITSSPPHSTQLIGLKLSQEFKIPWIADLRDPWTDIYYYKQFYPTKPAHRINLKMERSVLEAATKVLTVSPALKRLFEGKIKPSPNKIEVITNGFDADDFKNLPEASKDRFIITYVGTLAENYPLDAFINAFENFLNKNGDALLRFIGTVSTEHLQKLNALPEKNIEFIPYVDHRTAIEYMSKSSLLLLIIPDVDNNKGIVTGKLFEYMAVKRPILLIGPLDGDAADLLQKSKSGAAFDPDDIDGLHKLLLDWEDQLPLVTTNENYSRKKLSQQLALLMNEI